jgi:hypothetical protein
MKLSWGWEKEKEEEEVESFIHIYMENIYLMHGPKGEKKEIKEN